MESAYAECLLIQACCFLGALSSSAKASLKSNATVSPNWRLISSNVRFLVCCGRNVSSILLTEQNFGTTYLREIEHDDNSRGYRHRNEDHKEFPPNVVKCLFHRGAVGDGISHKGDVGNGRPLAPQIRGPDFGAIDIGCALNGRCESNSKDEVKGNGSVNSRGPGGVQIKLDKNAQNGNDGAVEPPSDDCETVGQSYT